MEFRFQMVTINWQRLRQEEMESTNEQLYELIVK